MQDPTTSYKPIIRIHSDHAHDEISSYSQGFLQKNIFDEKLNITLRKNFHMFCKKIFKKLPLILKKIPQNR